MSHRPHLLVVDDQRLDRAIATHAATQVGYEVSCATSVDEARALLASRDHFDCVVLDLALGSEDGLAALPLIARFVPDTVVILASGFDGRILSASQRLASSLGLRVSGVLRKPVLPVALQRLLRDAPLRRTRDTGPLLSIPPEQLQEAIVGGQITSWFQPQASLETGFVIGAEALARWFRPDGRAVSPASFVAISEQHGLAAPLTDLMLDQALQACARWRDKRPDCRVSVNVSPLLLDDLDLADRIEYWLQRHGLPSGALVVELTETSGIPETPCAMELLTRLRIRGVHLAVDDFGTGHSSMLSLVRMPFNEMKIDQAFVRDSVSNRDARKVVRASASLGRELGLRVVAEGVESQVLARIVEDAGCEVGQGWFYGRAVPPEMFEAQLDVSPAVASTTTPN